MHEIVLRKFWSRYFNLDWKLGVFIFLLFVAIRYWLVFGIVMHGGGGNSLFLLFLSMWFVPFILFTRRGRNQIGIRKPNAWIKLFYAFVIGILFCGLSFFVTYLIYGLSLDNSFVYMSRIFGIDSAIIEAYRYQIFMMSLLFGMTFSPIGEEFLFRGVIHSCFVSRFGQNRASLLDSLAFAIAHLPHFGILYIAGTWSIPFFPTLLWMFSLFILSRILFYLNTKSKSIWSSVFAHAGYNAMMMYINFFIIYA